MVLDFFNSLKLQTKLTLIIATLFIVPLLFASLYLGKFITKEYYTLYGERAWNVARFTAGSPLIIEELQQPGTAAFPGIEQYLSDLRKVTQVRYIRLLDQAGELLYSSGRSDAAAYLSERNESTALQNKGHLASALGPLVFSQKASAPVYTEDRTRLGSVEVGIMFDDIDSIIANISLPLQKAMFISMLISVLLVILLAQSIKKILMGLEPEEIATLLQERNAMLQMMTEGVIAMDLTGKINLVNDEAKRILGKAGIDSPLPAKPSAGMGLVRQLNRVMQTGVPEFDDEQTINGVAVLASHMPVTINNQVVGAISTFKDMSEIRQLAERITDINRYVDALRSQSHEFSNKLHVIMGLVNSGKLHDLRSYIEQLVDSKTQEDKLIYDSIKDPVVAGFLASKYSNARELGVSLTFSIDGLLPPIEEHTIRNGLITILGNLIDNAMDAMQNAREKRLHVAFTIADGCLSLSVSDTGEGMDSAAMERVFSKGYSTKGEGRGIGLWLVMKTLDSLGGTLDTTSTPDQGATFCLSLPLSRAAGEQSC